MAVPTKMSDLSLTAASNPPAGTDPVGNTLDDMIRAGFGITRSMRSISTASIASATTTDIAASDAEYVVVTGTTNIASLGTGFAGCVRQVAFGSALTLQHSSGLLLPGATNLTVATNDVLTFRCIAPSVWVLVSASRPSDSSKAPLASPALTGTPTVNGLAVGYRDIPLTTQNTAYSFAATDAGKGIVKADTSAYTYTVGAVFSAGQAVTVINAGSSGNVTLTGSGVTLQLSGSTVTGNRTVAPGGVVTLLFVSSTQAIVGGTGLT